MYDSLDKRKLWKSKTGSKCQSRKVRAWHITLYYYDSNVVHSPSHESHRQLLDQCVHCWRVARNTRPKSNWHANRGRLKPPTITIPFRDDVYKKLKKDQFAEDGDLDWIQGSYLDAFIRLVGSGFFALISRADGGLIKRVWCATDTRFDLSQIKCTRYVF